MIIKVFTVTFIAGLYFMMRDFRDWQRYRLSKEYTESVRNAIVRISLYQMFIAFSLCAVSIGFIAYETFGVGGV